jgi:pimeloyl-ACP methyl ester carboxylesterase
LRDILTKLELDSHKKIILCGHSTGGVAAIGYAAQYPDNIAGLILMDSVSLPMKLSLAVRLVSLPIVGTFLVKNFGTQGFVHFAHQSLAKPDESKDYLDKLQRNAFENPRFFAAVRSTMLHCKGFLGTTAEPEYRQCCEAKIPIHLIWGKQDKVCPYEFCCKLKAIAEDLGVPVSETSFEGMPHNIYFPDAKPEECAQSICEFVSTHK